MLICTMFTEYLLEYIRKAAPTCYRCCGPDKRGHLWACSEIELGGMG